MFLIGYSHEYKHFYVQKTFMLWIWEMSWIVLHKKMTWGFPLHEISKYIIPDQNCHSIQFFLSW